VARNKLICKLRREDKDLTFNDIGKMFGITRGRVQHIVKRAS